MSRVTLEGAISRDERAKLLALGGVAWIRLELAKVPMPEDRATRTVRQLSTEERQQILDKAAPDKVLARRFNIATTAAQQYRCKEKARAKNL